MKDIVQANQKGVMMVVGGCHTLSVADGVLVGDPIEREAFEQMGWKHDGRRTSELHNLRVMTLRKYQFESSLKRMSVVIQKGSTEWHVVTKGAPEVVCGLLKSVPSWYEKVFKEYVRGGKRVLSLASRQIT